MNIHQPQIFGETSTQPKPMSDFATSAGNDTLAMIKALSLAKSISGADLGRQDVEAIRHSGQVTSKVVDALGIVVSVLEENVLQGTRFDPLTEDLAAKIDHRARRRYESKPTSDKNELSRRERELSLAPLLAYVARMRQATGIAYSSKATYDRAA